MIFSGFYSRHALSFIDQFLFNAKILGYHLQIYEKDTQVGKSVKDLDIKILRDFMETLVT